MFSHRSVIFLSDRVRRAPWADRSSPSRRGPDCHAASSPAGRLPAQQPADRRACVPAAGLLSVRPEVPMIQICAAASGGTGSAPVPGTRS